MADLDDHEMMDTRPEDETPMEAEDDPAEDSLINADVSAEDEQDAVEEEHEDADMVEQAPASSSSDKQLSRREADKLERDRLKAIRLQQKKSLEEMRARQNAEVSQDKAKASRDRFKYLLQQTEIFSHFIHPTGSSSAASAASSSSGRGRKKRATHSERDEDAEIMREALEDAHPDGGDNSSGTRLTVTPNFLIQTLRPYQLEGLNWLINLYDRGINGILADEMGLGKTFQTISFLGYLKHIRGISGPHLVIAPKSVMPNWLREIKKFCPSLNAFQFHGNEEQRNELKRTKLVPGAFDIVVTSFEMVIREKAAFKKFAWRYICIDEAHRIKNEKSILSLTVRMFTSQFRLLLTGTPLQNNLHELWALLNFLLPDIFDNAEDFDAWFDMKDGKAESEIVDQLHKLLKPFMIRRLKADVERSLPPKKEVFVECGLSKMQKFWYTKLLSKDMEALTGAGASDRMRLLNIVMQLRKACNHPYLFDGAEPGPPFETGEHLVTNAGKMMILDKLLTRLKQQGSRVLIFSQMTRMLDILEDYMVYKGHEYCRIDGQTEGEVRERYVEEFNAPGSSKFVFLLSTRAGGLGINLATADTVIIYDSDWNPQADLQAQDRAHRIGQTKPVTVFRFVTVNAIEEKVYQRAMKKLYLDAVVIQQGRLVEQNKNASKEELMSMIRFGAEEIFKSRDSEAITDEDIDALLRRGAERAQEFNDKLQSMQNNLLSFSTSGMMDEDAVFGTFEFEGVDYAAAPTKVLYVENVNVAEGVTEHDLRNEIVGAGSSSSSSSSSGQVTAEDIKSVKVSLEKNSALITFRTQASAVEAFGKLQGKTLKGKELIVNYSTKKDALKEALLTSVITGSAAETSKRDRRALNYDVEAAMRASTQPAQPQPKYRIRKVKRINMNDFQFFDKQRVEELLIKDEKAAAAELEAKLQADRRKEAEESGQPFEEDEIMVDALTADEEKERQELLEHAFTDFNRKDYHAFIRGCEKYGRNNLAGIIAEVQATSPTMPEEEIKRYHVVFWQRYKEIDGSDRLLKRIEAGEARIEKFKKFADLLRWKTSHYANPWLELSFHDHVAIQQQSAASSSSSAGASSSSKAGSSAKAASSSSSSTTLFTEVEDRFLLCMTALLGYGNWDRLRLEVRKAAEFRFDWFIRTRSSEELRKRVDALIRMVEKEFGEFIEGVKTGLKDVERKKRNVAPKAKKEESSASSSAAAAAVDDEKKEEKKPVAAKKTPAKKEEKEKEEKKTASASSAKKPSAKKETAASKKEAAAPASKKKQTTLATMMIEKKKKKQDEEDEKQKKQKRKSDSDDDDDQSKSDDDDDESGSSRSSSSGSGSEESGSDSESGSGSGSESGSDDDDGSSRSGSSSGESESGSDESGSSSSESESDDNRSKKKKKSSSSSSSSSQKRGRSEVSKKSSSSSSSSSSKKSSSKPPAKKPRPSSSSAPKSRSK